ncbi:MAG: RNA polymerase sigma factor [bacterium]
MQSTSAPTVIRVRITPRRIVDRAEREQAFESLARDVGGRALSVALGLLGSPAAAEDAVQEAFERAFRGLDGYRGEAELSTWFLRIVVNTAHRHGRRGRRFLLRPEDVSNRERPTASGAESPQARTEAAEIQRRLTAALQGLPRRQRVAFVLRYVEGMSTDETAAVMDCASGTVKATLHKAVGKLRRELEDLHEEEPG